MNRLSKQQYADLAQDSYENRVVTPSNKTLFIGGNHYRVLAVHKNPTTDYQGVVYQDVRTNEIVVAHRGTSSLMDAKVDLKMVIHKANIQAEDAAKLTMMALKEADKFHNKHPEQSQPRITQVGHSLGGTLAQIQSYRFKQEGVTFNAYGAAALNGIPKGGDKVINYALASDVVSAAGPHYGKMVILAQNHELMGMWAAGYNTSINTFASQATPAALINWWSHSISNFTGPKSILSERNYRPALELAERNKKMIDDYRGDVSFIRSGIYKTNKSLNESQEMYRKIREKTDRDPNLMSWNDKEEQYNFMQTVASFNPQSLPPEAQKLFDSVKGHMTAYHEKNGLPIDKEKFQNSVMALTALGTSQGMTNATLFSVQRDQYLIGELNPHLNRVGMHINESASIPAVESLNQIQQATRQSEYDEQQRQIAQTQTRGMSLS
ncbi:lipase [Neisseria sp. P0001.S005]|jgi:triacylglycerol lipase|uniref:lipase n=1 Tax=Neisseria sp. P0001.S005 TaxID=3436649 RepID=UPI0028D88A53|nr:lipase [uncultured Neisseria sp.]